MTKKRILRWAIYIACTVAATPIAKAQRSTSFRPTGVSGSAGAGFAVFDIKSPATSFTMDGGVYAVVSVEKGFNFAHLYLTVSFAYLTATGQTNYNYTSLAGTNYAGTDVRFRANIFSPSLGLKLKIIDGFWLRPYVEGGGTAGFFQMEYRDLNSKVAGTGYKASDTLLDFGYYAEGGVEISFSESFGLRAGARYINSRTKAFDTLANQKIQYQSQVFFLGALASF